MNDDDARRRSGLTGWLTSKVEGLTGGTGLRRRRVETPATAPPLPRRAEPPQPAVDTKSAAEVKRLEAEAKRLQKELEDAQLMLMGKEAEFKNDLQDAQERNAELLDRVVKLTHRDRELQAKILDAKFDGSSAKDELKKLDSELRDQRRSLKAKEREVAELTTRVQELQQGGGGQGSAPDQAALEAQQRELEERQERANTLAAERDALSARLKDTETEMQTLREQLAAVQSQARATTPDLASSVDAGAVDEVLEVSVEPTLGHRRVASGQKGGPLLAVAAGKRPAVVQRAELRRLRRGKVAEQVLEQAAQRGGFASLPEPLLSQLGGSGAERSDEPEGPRRKRSRPRSRRGGRPGRSSAGR
ncbi:MAG: hypothetical protein ABI333_10375 [bacterium]